MSINIPFSNSLDKFVDQSNPKYLPSCLVGWVLVAGGGLGFDGNTNIFTMRSGFVLFMYNNLKKL